MDARTHIWNGYAVEDAVKAESIKNTLVEHGIRYELGGEHQAGFTGVLPIEIIVRESDETIAKELLKDHNLL